MQPRDQVKNWNVVVSAASVAALGLTGLVVASPDGSNNAPPAINIQDQGDDSAQLNTTTTTHVLVCISPRRLPRGGIAAATHVSPGISAF